MSDIPADELVIRSSKQIYYSGLSIYIGSPALIIHDWTFSSHHLSNKRIKVFLVIFNMHETDATDISMIIFSYYLILYNNIRRLEYCQRVESSTRKYKIYVSWLRFSSISVICIHTTSKYGKCINLVSFYGIYNVSIVSNS